MNKIIHDVGKLQRAHPTLRGHFASAYLVGSNMRRAYLFFIYGLDSMLNLLVGESIRPELLAEPLTLSTLSGLEVEVTLDQQGKKIYDYYYWLKQLN